MKTVIWDWNGTLLDDVTASVETMNAMLKKRGMKPFVSREEYQHVFCFPIIEYYNRLGYDYEKDSFETLSQEYIQLYHQQEERYQLFSDAKEAITQVKSKKIQNVVLSASLQDHLLKQMKECNCLEWFDETWGINDIYAKEKITLAKQWKQEHPQCDEVVLIGDSVHDYEVAQQLGWSCILVSRGHQAKDILLETKAQVCDNLDEAARLGCLILEMK